MECPQSLEKSNKMNGATAMPLRVGIIMDHPSPHMVALLDALAERDDCAAEVLYLNQAAPERRWGAPLGGLPCRFLKGATLISGGLRINLGLIQTLQQKGVDIWVLNTVYGAPSTLMAAWLLNRGSTPWVYMNEPPRPRNQFLSSLKLMPLQFVLRRAWGIIGMGEKAVEIYRSLARADCPMTSIPYYINLENFSEFPIPGAPRNGGSLKFLACCQMIHRKGLDILKLACEQLRDMSWQLTLVGDGPLRRNLEREFHHSFPDERVTFKGEIPYERRYESFAGHDIFVFPSRWDGWGMVVPEALAAGLPVVATDQVISAHEFIQNGVNGFSVPADDPGALAEKMAYFIRYPGNIHPMALAGRSAIQGFRPEAGAEKLVRFLTGITAKNNGDHRENPNRKIGHDPLTWKTLTAPDSTPQWAWKKIRHEAKESVIRLGNLARGKARPKGHRILAYHLVLKEDRKNFEEQMRFLKDHFLVCPISEIIEAMKNRAGSNPFRAAITFDDGFRVLMGDGLEILEKHGLKATFFIPTGFVELADQPEMAARFSLKAHYYNFALEPMRPEDLRGLVEMGHEVGSHGISHIGIRSMSRQRAIRELKRSAQRIGQWTGVQPQGFAYPNGHSESALGDPAEWIRQAGYSFGVTLKRGVISSGSDPLRLPREHAEGNWSVGELNFFLLS